MRLKDVSSGKRCDRFPSLWAPALAIAAQAVATAIASGASVTAALSLDSVVDPRGMTLQTAGTYGNAINGESFTQDTITSYDGYQYTAYWVTDTTTASPSYYVAVARRQIGTANWQVANLTNSTMVAGLSGGVPNDAHNVVSIGIDDKDGTIHLAYDMHSTTLKYRVSVAGVATNPGSVTWSSSLFTSAPTSILNASSTLPTSSDTYPAFLTTPSGDLQLFIRGGVSGNGVWYLYDYSGTTHTWDVGHQIDSGSGTYSALGTTQRNAYPNGFTYAPNGNLVMTYTYREGGGSANGTNHDIDYVYSTNGGSTWLNNAGTTVGTTSTQFGINSPGLTVVPLSQYTSLMNQQTQATDNLSQTHIVMWSGDDSKQPNPFTAFTPTAGSYYSYWRDGLGDWHRTTIPGSLNSIYSTRPKLAFDASDDAICMYNTGSNLVITAATAASNWTDWQVIYTGTNSYFSEVAFDPTLLSTNGILSIFEQVTPTTNLQPTPIHVLDFTVSLTPSVSAAYTGSSGNWATAASWSGSAVPGANTLALISGGKTVTVNSSVSTVGDSLYVGTGSAGALTVAAGAVLNVTNTISVGHDSSAAGTYAQTGGTVTTNRFIVGDFSTTTSGGGVSTATISGGSLTIGELQVAVSDNASSSGSSFNVAGGTVTVTGDAIIGDDGNTATVSVTGGLLTIGGDLKAGYNQINTATLSISGGTVNMTGNAITANNLLLNTGTLQNLSAYYATYTATGTTAAIVKNSAGTFVLGGSNNFTSAITISAGDLSPATTNAFGVSGNVVTITGGTNTGALQLTYGTTTPNPIIIAGRQPGTTAAAILNSAGTNTLSGSVGTAISGNQYNVESDAGLLVLASGFTNNQSGTANDVRYLNLSGAGNGLISGVVADNGSATNPARTSINMIGPGTWALSGANTYSQPTTISGGILAIGNNTASGTAGTSAVTVTGTGAIAMNRSDATSFANVITGTGGVMQTGSGTTTLTGALSYTGPTTVTAGKLILPVALLTPSSPLTVTSGSALISTSASSSTNVIAANVGGITVGATGKLALSAANRATNKAKVVITPNLSITGAGTFDLVDNDLIINGGTTIAQVTAMLAAGELKTSSTTPLVALGSLVNSDGQGGSLYSTFDGQAVSSTAVLVRYTYLGDTNLDGVVDANDLANTLAGLNGGLTGWANGDFNYSGTVTTADVTLLLNSLANQGAPLGNPGGPSGAVPEPSGLAFLVPAAVLFRRRR